MNQELTYWVALAHTPKIWTSRKNEIIAHCFQQGKNIIDFFSSNHYLGMELTQQEIELLKRTQGELANYAFMVEELLNQGYEIIPVTSKDYSPTLKSNLKYNSPIVLYTKGNKQILQETSIAIVGSRNANENALTFTDNVAKKASSEYKVVVSGFAKGVDKQALDSALAYEGQSIIVLPQGITTFTSNIKKYYKQVIGGNVLVLSTFHPKLPWSVDLAMARNSIIYGLASEIYAAQSDDKGGTWSGVTEGLKKGRKVFVRVPEKREKCANQTLIAMGATPVDIEGNPITETSCANLEENTRLDNLFSQTSANDNIEGKIYDLLSKGPYSSKQIIAELDLSDFSVQKMTGLLSRMKNISKIKEGKSTRYFLSSTKCSTQLSLVL
ncbi:MAG: DNA-processing protein DprA [Bacteroidales bacterium]|nr:DNA-processing protein DprA [Bacteroidales bacterium]